MKKFDFLSIFTVILIVSLLILYLFLSGCAEKPIIHKELVVKKVYIKTKCPKLKIYDFNKTLVLNAYNKGNKICIKEWNACIPKKQMINLIIYTKELKGIISNYKKEIEEYNKQFTK